jgi:hypothetical protein
MICAYGTTPAEVAEELQMNNHNYPDLSNISASIILDRGETLRGISLDEWTQRGVIVVPTSSCSANAAEVFDIICAGPSERVQVSAHKFDLYIKN